MSQTIMSAQVLWTLLAMLREWGIPEIHVLQKPHLQNLNKAHNVILAAVHAMSRRHMLLSSQQPAKVCFPQAAQVRLAPLVHQNVLEHKHPILIANTCICRQRHQLSSWRRCHAGDR